MQCIVTDYKSRRRNCFVRNLGVEDEKRGEREETPILKLINKKKVI